MPEIADGFLAAPAIALRVDRPAIRRLILAISAVSAVITIVRN